MRLRFLLLFLICFLIFAPGKGLAQDCDRSCQLGKEISELQSKLSTVQKESKTLSDAIAVLNLKQSLIQRQIDATQFQIDLLQREIDSLTGKISFLEIELNNLTTALLQNVTATYKRRNIDGFQILVSSRNFADAIASYKYLSVAQKYRQDLLFKTTQTKLEYDLEKATKEKKQKEIAQLKRQYERQNQELITQKRAKQALLSETKNNESKYQQLLAQALAERNAIEKALVSGVKVGPVKRGEAIALVGNSGYPGCSTAKHLHFEIRKNNIWVDPAPYLQSKSVLDEQEGRMVTIGSGSWNWPIEDPIRLTQHFGHTPYSWRYKYSGGIHTGFDMVSKSSDIIRAPADGTLFKSSEQCGSSTINIVYIDHGDNVLSFYLHVQ